MEIGGVAGDDLHVVSLELDRKSRVKRIGSSREESRCNWFGLGKCSVGRREAITTTRANVRISRKMMTKIAMTMMAMTTTKTCRLGVDHDDTVWRGSAQMIEALVVDFAESNHGPPDSILIFRYPCPTLNPGR